MFFISVKYGKLQTGTGYRTTKNRIVAFSKADTYTLRFLFFLFHTA